MAETTVPEVGLSISPFARAKTELVGVATQRQVEAAGVVAVDANEGLNPLVLVRLTHAATVKLWLVSPPVTPRPRTGSRRSRLARRRRYARMHQAGAVHERSGIAMAGRVGESSRRR